MKVGTIQSLWRFPVKSLQGEKLQRVELDERGLVGDRSFAVANADGKFGSGKNTRRFRRVDGLNELAARMQGREVVVTFPDGCELQLPSQEADRKVSEALGQKLTLAPEADVSHFDDGAIHIVTTQALCELQESLGFGSLDERRFRANFIIDMLPGGTVKELIGKRLSVDGTILKITHPTERCRMIGMDPDGPNESPEILKEISGKYDLNFGVYASVVQAGVVRVGATVALIESSSENANHVEPTMHEDGKEPSECAEDQHPLAAKWMPRVVGAALSLAYIAWCLQYNSFSALACLVAALTAPFVFALGHFAVASLVSSIYASVFECTRSSGKSMRPKSKPRLYIAIACSALLHFPLILFGGLALERPTKRARRSFRSK